MLSNIFKIKAKLLHKHNNGKTKFNYVNKAKHSPPLIKEWFSSIYAYNKNIVKLLPILDKNLYKLISSYFNLYNNKLEDKANSNYLRIKTKRFSINKLLISKPNIKHTNDEINITVYTYNERKKYFLNKIDHNMKDVFVSFISSLKKEMIELNLKIKERTDTLLKIISNARTEEHGSLSDHINKTYITNYVKKRIEKKITLVIYRQSIYFEQCKHEKLYLIPLIALVQRLYNKKIVFNIVNLKYIYNSSSIFSNILVSKLNDRKNKLLEVLAASLNACELSPSNKFNIYTNTNKEKALVQRLAVQDLIPYHNNSYNSESTTSYFLDKKDAFDELLLKTNDNYIKLITPEIIMSNVIKSVKHKHITGVRVEVAGRLTKNSKAQRSVFKFNYKGSLKNTDSSHKGLPVVLLRGYAKTNIMYTQCKSKFRVGAYGLKTWISSI